MSRKQKIVIPTEQEVDAYGEAPAPAKATASDGPGAGEESPVESTGPEAAAEPRSEAEEWKDKFLRAKAELANYRRRAEKDRSETLRYANAPLVQALLPILDDLERVIASGSEPTSEVKAVVSGVTLTLENFLRVLDSFHVSRIEALGKPFDPAVHEAMMQQPSREHSEPTAIQEMVKGYRLHDRVLRPARVVVSKPAQDAAEDPGGADAQSEAPDETDGD